LAEKELETHLDANIWLSNKVQNALVTDYTDISDRYDRQLALDDMLTQGLIMQAVDKAIELGQLPGKYYRNLDVYSIIRLQEASNQTMKNKLELISKGFFVYKIKKHIDHLRNQQKKTTDKTGFKDGGLDLSSFHSQSATSYSKPLDQSNCDNNPSQKDEYPQDYLDRYDLVIGMAGKPIKRYLAEIEKKIGKPMSSI
jgi:lipopolysaccharide export LptBFGC system permease protein LptF